MPPANSRASSPPAGTVPSAEPLPPYLSALRELESPVDSDILNLADTLTTQVEDEPLPERDINSYLASTLQSQNEQRILEEAREDLRREQSRTADRERRERLRRVMNRLSRIHDPPAYSDRTPTHNVLYDWSPANETDEEELDLILQELRREQPSTHPEILRVLGRSQLDAERESRLRSYSSRLLGSNQPAQATESSLRSAAILQSVRRHPRFSARTRDYLQRFASNRDSGNRSTLNGETRERASPSRTMAPGAQDPPRHRSYDRLDDAERNVRQRLDSFRTSNLGPSAQQTSPPSPMLESTIKYLSEIRDSSYQSESWGHAITAGIADQDYAYDEEGRPNPDLVLETFTISPPAKSSWLVPGAVLSGYQHAQNITTTTISPISMPRSNTTLYRFRDESTMTSIVVDSARQWQAGRRHLRLGASAGPETVTTHSPQPSSWPVKVSIHAVDYEKMTLAATMEAYNVPSHPLQTLLSSASTYGDPTPPPPPQPRTASITTYLEGEILDFNTFTLLTENFKSSPQNDATYWRKLPPFQALGDEELAEKLVSRKWIEEELAAHWILMRWKERCFVKSLKSSPGHVDAVGTESSTPTTSFSGSGMSNLANAAATSFSSTSTNNNRENRNPNRSVGTSTSTSSYSVRDGRWLGTATSEDDGSVYGCGLTISGFYYVALRRCDGRLEGLYCDPQSSPYQHLRMESLVGGVLPAWGFR